MKNITNSLLAVLFALISMSAAAQIPPARYKPTLMVKQDSLRQAIDAGAADYTVAKDAKNDRVVYKGIFTYRELEQEPTFSWLPKGMDDYRPNTDAIAYLKKNIHDYKLLVFAGTWCGDSHDLLPRLYKVLSAMNISYEDIMIVGMDRDKTTHIKQYDKLVKKYKIRLLPTFVLIDKNGKEAGRIVESVRKSIEEDLVEIVKGGG